MFPSSSNTSERTPSSESYEKLLQSEDGQEHADYKPTSRQAVFWPAFIAPFVGLLLVGIGVWIGNTWPWNADYKCLLRTQHYSPILKEVDTSYHSVIFNGSFLKANIYRQDASPEVDAAWEALGVNYHAVAVPLSEAPATGIASDQVQISSKYGGGYPANVEGLHHLHCLNLVRQGLWYNYDYYHARGGGAFANEDYVVRYHVTHCLDIIRQQLMCQPDTGLLGQVWWDPEEPKAFVDFNTEHKCKNYEAIRRWAEERQLPNKEVTPLDYLVPPSKGQYIHPEIP